MAEVMNETYRKFLIKDNNVMKAYVKGESNYWKTVGTAPGTPEIFETEGMEDISIIDDSAIQLLESDNLEIICWTNLESPGTIRVTAIPDQLLLKAINDIKMKYVDKIDYIQLTAQELGETSLRLIASVDSGRTWKTFLNGNWIEVDTNNIDEIATTGITPYILNHLTSENWDSLFGGYQTERKLRFGYYLSINSLTDVLSADDLSIQVDLAGEWEAAIHLLDYDYEYSNNRISKVSLYTNGDYKINF